MRWLKRGVRSLLGRHRYERFKQYSRKAGALAALDLQSLGYEAEAEWANGEIENAITRWRTLEEVQPSVADWPFKISRAADVIGDHLRAEKILSDAVARGACSIDIDERLAFYRRWNRLSNAAEDDAIALIRDPNASPVMVHQAVGYLLAQGRLTPAREGLARIQLMPQLANVARSHGAALAILQQAQDEGRPILSGWLSPARDAISVREPGADTTVIVFTTLRGDLGMPISAIHALLQPAKVNAIYLYDERNLFHLGGNPTFGKPYPAMIDGLRSRLREWDTRTLITMGFSGPGFTALRAGLDLGAQGALLFSPVLTLYRRPEFAIEGALGRSGDDARMLTLEKYMRRTVPELMTYIPDELAKRTCLETIEVHHGQHLPDLVHAYEARDVPDMDFIQVENFPKHECLSEIVRRGDKEVMTRFVKRVREGGSRWKG